MATVADHLSADDLKDLRSLQLLAKQAVDGACSGLHRSPHKGFSVEFKQHRQYVAGDELRYLDWKVFGKTDRFFIREYEDQTNLRCTILLDTSGSMAFRGEKAAQSKYDYAVRLAASLGYLMLQQTDAVGLATFDDDVRSHIPPRSRPSHLSTILETLVTSRPGRETDVAGAFRKLLPKIRRWGMLLVLSDCFGDPDALLRSLAHLRHRGHDVTVFQIWDREELEFPFTQRMRFESLETDEFEMVDPAHLRRTYLQQLGRFRERLQQGCYRHRVDLVPMVTDQPYSQALAAYLAIRKGR